MVLYTFVNFNITLTNFCVTEITKKGLHKFLMDDTQFAKFHWYNSWNSIKNCTLIRSEVDLLNSKIDGQLHFVDAVRQIILGDRTFEEASEVIRIGLEQEEQENAQAMVRNFYRVDSYSSLHQLSDISGHYQFSETFSDALDHSRCAHVHSREASIDRLAAELSRSWSPETDNEDSSTDLRVIMKKITDVTRGYPMVCFDKIDKKHESCNQYDRITFHIIRSDNLQETTKRLLNSNEHSIFWSLSDFAQNSAADVITSIHLCGVFELEMMLRTNLIHHYTQFFEARCYFGHMTLYSEQHNQEFKATVTPGKIIKLSILPSSCQDSTLRYQLMSLFRHASLSQSVFNVIVVESDTRKAFRLLDCIRMFVTNLKPDVRNPIRVLTVLSNDKEISTYIETHEALHFGSFDFNDLSAPPLPNLKETETPARAVATTKKRSNQTKVIKNQTSKENANKPKVAKAPEQPASSSGSQKSSPLKSSSGSQKSSPLKLLENWMGCDNSKLTQYKANSNERCNPLVFRIVNDVVIEQNIDELFPPNRPDTRDQNIDLLRKLTFTYSSLMKFDNRLHGKNRASLHHQLVIFKDFKDNKEQRKIYLEQLLKVFDTEAEWKMFIVLIVGQPGLLVFDKVKADVAFFPGTNTLKDTMIEFLQDFYTILNENRQKMLNVKEHKLYEDRYTKVYARKMKDPTHVKRMPEVGKEHRFISVLAVADLIYQKSFLDEHPEGKSGGGSYYSFISKAFDKDSIQEYGKRLKSLLSGLCINVRSVSLMDITQTDASSCRFLYVPKKNLQTSHRILSMRRTRSQA